MICDLELLIVLNRIVLNNNLKFRIFKIYAKKSENTGILPICPFFFKKTKLPWDFFLQNSLFCFLGSPPPSKIKKLHKNYTKKGQDHIYIRM